MPRAFTKQEQAVINERLLESGAKLFGRYGLRKTTVEEITRDAGISKGSFYRFFESKELLCFTILETIQAGQRCAFCRDDLPDRINRAACDLKCFSRGKFNLDLNLRSI